MSWMSAKLSVSGSTVTFDGSTVANVEWGLLDINGVLGSNGASPVQNRNAGDGLVVMEPRNAGRTITMTGRATSATAGALATGLEKLETVVEPSTAGTTIKVTLDGSTYTWTGWLRGQPRFRARPPARTFTVGLTFVVPDATAT